MINGLPAEPYAQSISKTTPPRNANVIRGDSLKGLATIANLGQQLPSDDFRPCA